MAFLRSICAHRTTNLIYSRASNVRYDTSSSPTSTSSSSSSASSASTLKNCNWPSSVNLSRQVATSSVNNNNGSSENSGSGSESNDQICNLKKRQLNQQQNNGLLVQKQQSKPQQQQTRLFNNQRQSQDIKSRSNFNTIKTSESILSETRSTKSTSSTSCKKRDAIDTSFNDPEAAFKSKTTWELTRAYIVYIMCSSEKLVEHNLQIMKVMRTLMGTKLFSLLMKATFYGHFVAGEDQIKIVPILERLRSFGVKPILDYSVEEDISQEEAEKREVASSVSSAAPDDTDCDSLPQYHVDKSFADRRYKVSSARTYFYLNEATCERNMDIFIKCLEAVSEHDAKFPPLTKPEGATFGTGFTAIKLTALGRPQLLLQLSEVIMRTRKYMEDLVGGHGNVLSHHKTIQDLEKYYDSLGDNKDVKTFLKNVTSDKEGILHLFPWSGIVDENSQLSETFRVPDPKTGQMRRLISQIPPNEEEMFRNMIRRVNTIAKVAQELDVRFMIDAEQTYFQPAISRITLELMRKYNTERAYVFNTYQCYLKDAYQEVVTDLEQAKRQNFFFGAKLVRGAYMDQERARATALGYPDPVNPTYEATTASYNKTLEECLRRIKILKDSNDCTNKIGIMVASHNEDTVRFGLEKMKEYGIEPEDKVVCFGQLLGMCDYITFPLGQGGYSVYKYIPYGPVHEVLPYLSRRATENKGVLKKIKKEKRLLLNELRNRVLSGKIFYKPKGEYVPL